jgi:hypothetical protein
MVDCTRVSPVERSPQIPDRNLALELVRVTEAAAMAASRWMGRGDKNGADGAAVEAMRVVLSSVQMDGIVVIGATNFPEVLDKALTRPGRFDRCMPPRHMHHRVCSLMQEQHVASPESFSDSAC